MTAVESLIFFCYTGSYKDLIWQEGDTMYYPKGVTDPDYCVLKFTAETDRYYSNFKSETFEIQNT